MRDVELSSLGFVSCVAPAMWQRSAVDVQADGGDDKWLDCTLILVAALRQPGSRGGNNKFPYNHVC